MAIELYNGVILPDIPEEVVVNFPYITISWLLTSTSSIAPKNIAYIFQATKVPQLYIDQVVPANGSSIQMATIIPSDGNMTADNLIQGGYQNAQNGWFQSDSAIIPLSSNNVNYGSIVWSNHDIMRGTLEITDNDITGVSSTGEKFEYMVENLKDYNGTKLVEISESLTVNYPFAVIIKNSEVNYVSSSYVLVLSDQQFLYVSEDLSEESTAKLVSNSSLNIKIYVHLPSMEWVEYQQEIPDGFPLIDSDGISTSVLWSNQDIMIAEKDESGNYIATDKIYDYIIDFIDYNGVLLPELPATDYSYAFIVDASSEALNGRGDGYILFLTNSKPVALLKAMTGEENDVVYIDGETSMYAYIENATNNWTNIDQQDYINIPINNQEYMMNLLWSKDDIMVAIDYNGILIETEQVYFPLKTEDTLPDVEYTSEYYVAPTSWISSIAKQTRRITGNYTRLTAEKIEEALTNFGSYREVFNKTIEEIDFKLPKLIYPYSFAYCLALKSISSDNVLIVGTDAFMSCSSLNSISFPSATTIDGYAFEQCDSLVDVNLPLVKNIGYGAFYSCDSLVSINLPNVTEVSGVCFSNCSKLKNVNLPKAETIGNSSFDSCTDIEKIDLPSVKTFGDNWNNRIFYGCINLTALILRNTTMVAVLSDSNQQMFYNTPIASGTGYIYVPAALVDTYKADAIWSTYADQFRALEDYTVDGTITGELDETKI